MLTSVCHIVKVTSHADLRCRHMFFFRDNDKADALILLRILTKYYCNYMTDKQFVYMRSLTVTEDETRFICDRIEYSLVDVQTKMKNTQDALKEHDVMIRLGEPPLGIFHQAHCVCSWLCCCLLRVPPRKENNCSFY